MTDWFLNGMVSCSACGAELWFSPEGYMLCSCPGAATRVISARDVEKAFIEAIVDKLLNDDVFISRVTRMTNMALGASGNLTQKQVSESLLSQYNKIFNSANYLNKRKLALTLVKSVKILPDLVLEIEYNEI
ncbi:MAG TPA: hypothetical protein PK467_18770 [Candidatus Wallbacteria bacterium]|nr:hypothetical protein [Candidatus Wallbacteria bacterium]